MYLPPAHKIYCQIYREVPALLPFPGDGERQASLSNEVASCRGKDIECANLLNEANQDRRHTYNWHYPCQVPDRTRVSSIETEKLFVGLSLKDIGKQI